MNAADSRGSPSDRGGGSSPTPPPDRGGGSSSTPSGPEGELEVIEVNDDKAVLVISPALAYDMQGEVYSLPADTVKAVDDFTVPKGYRREGSRDRSYMYSLGVYVTPLDEEDEKHKYFCLASPTCRKNKAFVPCKKGDRSNVNTHLKSKHKLRGVAGAVKAGKQKQAKGTIQRSFEASRNSGAGTNRCVCENCKLALEHKADGSGQGCTKNNFKI